MINLSEKYIKLSEANRYDALDEIASLFYNFFTELEIAFKNQFSQIAKRITNYDDVRRAVLSSLARLMGVSAIESKGVAKLNYNRFKSVNALALCRSLGVKKLDMIEGSKKLSDFQAFYLKKIIELDKEVSKIVNEQGYTWYDSQLIKEILSKLDVNEDA